MDWWIVGDGIIGSFILFVWMRVRFPKLNYCSWVFSMLILIGALIWGSWG